MCFDKPRPLCSLWNRFHGLAGISSGVPSQILLSEVASLCSAAAEAEEHPAAEERPAAEELPAVVEGFGLVVEQAAPKFRSSGAIVPSSAPEPDARAPSTVQDSR